MSWSGLSRLTLHNSTNALLFSFLLQLFVNLDTSQEVLSALGVLDVLHSYINPRIEF